MGKDYQEIDERIIRWLDKQHVFFVATAPDAGDGLINCSPKGLDCFSVIDAHTVAYADTGGSGIETVAHLKENGRIVIMFCAFDGPPNIYRFYGRGRVVESQHPDFKALADRFTGLPAIRNVIVVDVSRIRDSCGYGVPNYEFRGHRESLGNWVSKKGKDGLRDYFVERNATSLDGLPGLDVGDLANAKD